MKVSYKVLFAAVLATAGTPAIAADAAVTGLATTNYVKGAIESLDSNVANADGVISTITVTNGKITNTARKKIADADVNAISQAKITGLTGALNAKQTTDNMVKAVADVTDGNRNSTTQYPSMAAAQKIAADAVAKDLGTLPADVQGLTDEVDALQNWKDNFNAEASTGNGMVKTVTYSDGTITATRETVKTADIQDLNVTTAKLAADAVTNAKLADSAVQTENIKDGAITAKKIVVADNIKGTGSVTVSQDATTGVITVNGTDTKYTLPAANDTTLGGVKTGGDMTATNGELTITAGKVTEGKIGTGAVTNAKLGANAVTEGKIATGAVTNTKLGADAVTNAKLADNAVQTENIKDGAITAKKITVADNIVGAGSVTVSQNSTSGVITISGTDTKYTLPAANGATLGGVKTGGDMTATNGELTITAGKVTEGKIGSNAVTSAKIANDAVTTAKIKGYDNSGSTKECNGTNCALVDLGAGAVWLPIVNEYTGS